MRAVDPIVSRARFIMEEFIQHLTPLNMMKTSTPGTVMTRKVRDDEVRYFEPHIPNNTERGSDNNSLNWAG